MHQVPLRGALAVLALLGLSLAAPLAQAGPGKPAALVNFDERIGATVAAAHNGVGQDPYASGALELSPDASHVHLLLRWGAQTGPKQLTFRACVGWCTVDGDGPTSEGRYERVVERTHGDSPLTLRVEVPPSRNLTWDAYLENGTATEIHIDGWAAIHDDEPHEDAGAFRTQPTLAGAKAPAADQGGAVEGLARPGALFATAAGLVWLWLKLRPTPVARLYSRIDPDELLHQSTRRQIHDRVLERPGVHFEALAEGLDLGHGALDHHLGLLVDAGILEELRAHGYCLYFVPGQLDPSQRRALAASKSKGARSLLEVLAEDPTTLTEAARAAGVAVSTASHHADRLTELSVLDEEREGRRRTLSLTQRGVEILEHLA